MFQQNFLNSNAVERELIQQVSLNTTYILLLHKEKKCIEEDMLNLTKGEGKDTNDFYTKYESLRSKKDLLLELINFHEDQAKKYRSN